MRTFLVFVIYFVLVQLENKDFIEIGFGWIFIFSICTIMTLAQDAAEIQRNS